MRGLRKNLIVFFKRSWPIGLLTIIVLGFFWKTVLKNYVPIPGDFIVGVYFPWLDYKWGYLAGVPVKNPITTDVVSFTYPMQSLAMNLIKHGTWPLWNPYILSGTTLLANFQSAPFAPTSFVYLLFNNVTAWSIQVILQFILGATFTYFLLRFWKLSKIASIFGGVVFVFSGYNLIFSEWNGHTLAAAFIPLALLFTDRFLQKQKYWDGVGLSVTLALQFFSGYTQTSVYTAVAIGILWLIRIIENKVWFKKTFSLALFCLFGIILSGVQILPSLELIQNSQRVFEPHPYEWAFLPWKKTITFVAPDYFGNHATGNYWGPQDYTSNTGYVGVVAVILSFLAILTFIKRYEVKFLLFLAIVALVLSFPDPISIFIWRHDLLGMRANSAHRATVLFCAAIAYLSAFGLEAFATKIHKFWVKFISLLPIYVLMATFSLFAIFLFKNPIGLRNLAFPGLILMAVTITLFLPRKLGKYIFFVLVIVELFRFGWKFEPISPAEFTYPTTPVLTFLQNQQKPFRTTGARVIPSNFRMPYGIESIEGYDTFHPLNVSEFIAAINSGDVTSLPVGRYGIVDNDVSPLLDLVNTKYYLALKDNETRFKNPRFKLVFSDKSVDIFESKTTLPRAFMVYTWQVDKPQKGNDLTSLRDIMQEDFPLGKKIILDEAPNISESKLSQNSVSYKVYDNQRSILDVKTEKDGMLFISDTYYPGWHAYVDGVEIKIYKADFAFRAVTVPAGEHIVEMVYEPESFYNGLKISLVAFGILICLGFLAVGKRKLRGYT